MVTRIGPMGIYVFFSEYEEAQARIAALEAQLAERVPTAVRQAAKFTREDLSLGGTNYPHVRAMLSFIEGLSALEATPPAPKVTDEMVDLVLDAAGDHILFQYGFGALHHPTDRQQIKNSLSGDAS